MFSMEAESAAMAEWVESPFSCLFVTTLSKDHPPSLAKSSVHPFFYHSFFTLIENSFYVNTGNLTKPLFALIALT